MKIFHGMRLAAKIEAKMRLNENKISEKNQKKADKIKDNNDKLIT